MAREHYGRELWERMLDFARVPDPLPVYDCGDWTREKLFVLCHYIAVVTKAMRNRWSEVNYLDLFASSGICNVLCEDGIRRRYPGSALLAAGSKHPFANLFLVERDQVKLEALKIRIQRLKSPSVVCSWSADANAAAPAVAEQVKSRSLTIGFVDPFSLDIHFDSIASLAARRHLDLIILFAVDIDLLRNVRTSYYPNPESKLDKLLGATSSWRDQYDALDAHDAPRVRKLFADIYLQQLARLGYTFTSILPIPRDSRPLYYVVFASKNEMGLRFWHIAQSETLGGQRDLFRDL